jgi:hypothetical protein
VIAKKDKLWTRRVVCAAEVVALVLPGPGAPQKDGAKGCDDRNTVERALGPPNKAYGETTVDEKATERRRC